MSAPTDCARVLPAPSAVTKAARLTPQIRFARERCAVVAAARSGAVMIVTVIAARRDSFLAASQKTIAAPHAPLGVAGAAAGGPLTSTRASQRAASTLSSRSWAMFSS